MLNRALVLCVGCVGLCQVTAEPIRQLGTRCGLEQLKVTFPVSENVVESHSSDSSIP